MRHLRLAGLAGARSSHLSIMFTIGILTLIIYLDRSIHWIDTDWLRFFSELLESYFKLRIMGFLGSYLQIS